MHQEAKVSVPTEETQGSVSSHSWESTGQTSLRTFKKKTYSHDPLAVPGKEKKSKNMGFCCRNNNNCRACCLSLHAGGEASTLVVVRRLSPIVMFDTRSSRHSRNHIFSFSVFSCRDIKPDNILLDEHGKPVMNAF